MRVFTRKQFFLPITFLLLSGIGNRAIAQNPIYFSTRNFNPPFSWVQDSAVRMGTVANTNIQIASVTALGNVYFRFYSALSGGTNYESNSDTNVLIPLDAPLPLQVSGGFGTSFYFNVAGDTAGNNFVFKTNGEGAPGNTNFAVFRIYGPVQSIVSLSQSPAVDVDPGQDVTITATISDTFSAGQGVYLRYTTDQWNSSTVMEMTGSGTTYSAVIPGSVTADNDVAVNYYAFTSGDSLTITGDNADLMTINLINNNFNNFTYVSECDFTSGNPVFSLTTSDKARYNPRDSVHLNASFNANQTGNVIAKYFFLGDSIGEQTIPVNNATAVSWSWLPPDTNYRGYMVELYLKEGSQSVDSTAIAIDVSSDWKKFPRYGFVSAYPETDSSDRMRLFTMLTRYHLNGLQFYDFQFRQEEPLAGTVAHPDTLWYDIANRATYLSTIEGYISLAHSSNMKTMAYNLIYGAYTTTAVADGVLPQWGLYYDADHQYQWSYSGFPAGWATTGLIVEDPADTGWQQYILGHESDLFKAIPFDGWHVDQLGNFGTAYDYYGNPVNVPDAFQSMLQVAKDSLNNDLVMNAVTNFGQPQIAASPVDFLYTEVWPPYLTYNDLVSVIDSNNLYGGDSLATVLAAYLDIGLSNNLGSITDSVDTFGIPGVLLADATIFASGGAHIELGDHMLSNPYFPNATVQMSCTLQQDMIHYYDFLVAYENLLRDSISNSPVLLNSSGSPTLSTSATQGSIWVMSKQKTNTQIFHLINMTNINDLSWRDSFATQPAPTLQQNLAFSFTDTQYVKSIFVASPDFNNGCPVPLNFTQGDSTVSFTVPQLNYWDMVIVEYGIRPPLCNLTSAPNTFKCPNYNDSIYNAFTVTVNSGCYWLDTVTSGGDWLFIDSNTATNGNGNIYIHVLQNSADSLRTGTIGVNGQILTVIQPADTTAGISTVSPASHVTVFPNPFTNEVNFSFSMNAGQAMIRITDELGRTVSETSQNLSSGAQSLTIPFSNLAEGLYFWSVEISGKGNTSPIIQNGKLVHSLSTE